VSPGNKRRGQGQARPLLYCAGLGIVGAGLVPAHGPNPCPIPMAPIPQPYLHVA
jgi:hypothetical protein